ncbi:MAG: sulfotransferase, partial [Myxococcota bacterium]
RTHTANRGWRRAPDVAPIPQLAQTWSTFVRAARKSGQALGQARYLEVRYENLLSDPIPVLGKALRFFGEALDEGVLRGAAEVRPGKTWRETLVPAELVAFCTVHPAEMLLHHLGYPPTPTPAHRSLEIQVGARPAPSAPLQARIDRGESSPQLWFEAGEAALQARDQKRAVSHFVRAIRGQAIDRRAVLRLLEMPDAPESVFAAMNAERMMAPDMRAALTRWASGRGLDEAASRALFAPKSETEAA